MPQCRASIWGRAVQGLQPVRSFARKRGLSALQYLGDIPRSLSGFRIGFVPKQLFHGECPVERPHIWLSPLLPVTRQSPVAAPARAVSIESVQTARPHLPIVVPCVAHTVDHTPHSVSTDPRAAVAAFETLAVAFPRLSAPHPTSRSFTATSEHSEAPSSISTRSATGRNHSPGVGAREKRTDSLHGGCPRVGNFP